MSRVVEAPVKTVHLSREHRACLVCIPAHGDHGIDGAIQKLIHVLGVVSGNVDADFPHDFDRFGMNIAGGFGTCAGDLDEIAGSGTKEAFCKVTAARIAGAEDQDEWF